MNTLFVEPRDPCTRRDLEVVETLPVTAVVRKDGRVAKELSLEDGEHRLGPGVDAPIDRQVEFFGLLDRIWRWMALGVGGRSRGRDNASGSG